MAGLSVMDMGFSKNHIAYYLFFFTNWDHNLKDSTIYPIGILFQISDGYKKTFPF